MTTGKVSSADISAMLLNMNAQSNAISSGTDITADFQSIFTQAGQNTSQYSNNSTDKGLAINNVDSDKAVSSQTSNRTKDIVKNQTTDKNSDDDDTLQITDEVRDIVKNVLGLTDEELDEKLSELGLTVVDLLNPQNAAILVASVNDAAVTDVITDSSMTGQLQDIMNDINHVINDFAAKTGQSVEEIIGNLNDYFNENVIETPENIEGNENADITDASDTKDTNNSENTQTVTVVTDEETGKEIKITIENSRVSDTNTQITDSQSNQQIAQTNEENFDSQNQNGSSNSDQNNNSQTIAQTFLNNLSDAVQGSMDITSDFSQMNNVSSLDIVNQMIEAVKVNVNVDTTSMELQLTPENLGRVNLTVAAKDGIVTATIVTQNEAVKTAIENQVAQLKENLNNQGLKVQDVEVTIASHGFEANAENNQNNSNDSHTEKHRKFKSLEDIPEDDLSAEKILEQRIMESNGNSLNITA